jgi:hypothetical protein
MPLDTRLAALITAIGADIKALQAASGGGGAAASPLDLARSDIVLDEDFLSSETARWDLPASLTGAGTQAVYGPTEGNTNGTCQLHSGTDAFGRAAIRHLFFAALGKGAAYFSARAKLSHLNAADAQMAWRLGFGDSDFSAPYCGAFFEYDHTVSPYWRCRTSVGDWMGTTTTSVVTNVLVAASTWYSFGIQVNAAGTEAKFYINGTLVATITTNIPGAAFTTGVGAWGVRAAGNANRWLTIDYIKALVRYTTLR